MSENYKWSSKLVYKDPGYFFIRSIRLNPFDCYLHIIVIRDSDTEWYDFMKDNKKIDIWDRIKEFHKDDFVSRLTEGEKKLVEDFLNRKENKDGGACLDNGGICLFPKNLNHCFMMIREDRGTKNCLTTLVHETFHVIQRVALRHNTDIASIDTSEVFAYMSDMIFEEFYDDIIELYSTL